MSANSACRNPWSDDTLVSTLKKLWADGFSAGFIARELTKAAGFAITRSAVIGKVHRLDIAARVKPVVARYVPPPKPKAVKPPKPVVVLVPVRL